MIDSSAIQSGLPVGEALTLGDWFEVMPYCDSIRLYTLAPKQLVTLLKDNALRIDYPSKEHIERGFLQFSYQLRYQVLMGIDRKHAVPKNIILEGIPLKEFPKETLTIATTSFIRQSAKGWECDPENPYLGLLLDLDNYHHIETEIYLRQEMVAYIQDHKGISKRSGAQQDGRLKILVPGEYHDRKSLWTQSS
jgi:5'-nucleotidase/5'-nucleotidase/UDP-sugar diphosphatase